MNDADLHRYFNLGFPEKRFTAENAKDAEIKPGLQHQKTSEIPLSSAFSAHSAVEKGFFQDSQNL